MQIITFAEIMQNQKQLFYWFLGCYSASFCLFFFTSSQVDGNPIEITVVELEFLVAFFFIMVYK